MTDLNISDPTVSTADPEGDELIPGLKDGAPWAVTPEKLARRAWLGSDPNKIENLARKVMTGAGASVANPLDVAGSCIFRGVAYLRISTAETLSTSNVTNFAYTFDTNGEYVSASFRLDVVSGLHSAPLTMMGTLAGNVFTLGIAVSGLLVIGNHLSRALIVRVVAENDYVT